MSGNQLTAHNFSDKQPIIQHGACLTARRQSSFAAYITVSAVLLKTGCPTCHNRSSILCSPPAHCEMIVLHRPCLIHCNYRLPAFQKPLRTALSLRRSSCSFRRPCTGKKTVIGSKKNEQGDDIDRSGEPEAVVLAASASSSQPSEYTPRLRSASTLNGDQLQRQ